MNKPESNTNEFESIDVEEAPPTETNEVPGQQSEDEYFDYRSLSDKVKAPPRVDLDGKILVVKKALIARPLEDSPWLKTRKGDKEFKPCSFSLHYDFEGQVEFFSGVRVFKKPNGKYSDPSITRDRKNQASELLGLYCDFKKRNINEVTLKEFLAFFDTTLGNPPVKAKIKVRVIANPTTGEQVRKNLVECFVP